MSKHEKIAFLLSILAGLLLIISCCPGGWEQATGILQGLATGLLSGMGLFWVTGIKNKEHKELENVFNTINKFNSSLKIIDEAYGHIYHKTYHGKKEHMSFKSYLNIVRSTYNIYKSAYESMSYNNVYLISDKNISESINQYIDYLAEKLESLEIVVNSVKDGDKDTLNESIEKFYDIQYKTYQLRSKIMKFERDTYKKLLHIDNSFI